MISRERAREIALQAISNVERLSEGTGVSEVLSFEELRGRQLCIYWTSQTPIERSWVVYIERPVLRLESSLVVLISKDDGEILYAGSAGDEG